MANVDVVSLFWSWALSVGAVDGPGRAVGVLLSLGMIRLVLGQNRRGAARCGIKAVGGERRPRQRDMWRWWFELA